MSPGTYISLTLHASLVGWLLFNGDFEPTPLELPVTEVSVVSSEMFDIMVNNTAPIIEMELEAASRQPLIEDTQAPADSTTDKAPQQVTQMLSQIAQNDALPETVPNQPERMEEVVIIPPLELTAPEIEAEAPEPFIRLYFERCLQKTVMRSTFNFSFMIKLKSLIFVKKIIIFYKLCLILEKNV